jgi:DNA repair protein SbcD/Mre11
MKILHTSDWHLGRTLYSKKERTEEHKAFLNWLLQTIAEHQIDVLIIAGDIFDTASPNHSSQKLYYDFLVKVQQQGCQHVVVVGGNHDSPSFLNAPKDVLAALDVRIVGHAEDDLSNEILVLNNHQNEPALIVCGVPFLRERDISRFTEGESYTERSARINQNIKKHYELVAALALEKQKQIGKQLPIIATGHLSVAGGKRNEDDGVRETYIGNIEEIGSDIFPDVFDYVALGHYHVPSAIKEHIRYCGSPIPMGFGEAKQTKCVYSIWFDPNLQIETIEIPNFQALATIKGNKQEIEEQLKQLKQGNCSVWAEISYTGNEVFPDLVTWINLQTEDSLVEVLKIQNKHFLNEQGLAEQTQTALEDLNVFEVFDKLLASSPIQEEQKQTLLHAYQEIVNEQMTGEAKK